MAIKTPKIHVYPRADAGGTFYAKVSGKNPITGKRSVPFSIGTKDPEEAELWRQKELARLRRVALGIESEFPEDTKETTITLEEAWRLYSELAEVKRKSIHTLNLEALCFKMFREWCAARGVITIEAVTPMLIKEYRRHMQTTEKAGGGLRDSQTVNNYIRDVGVVWKYLTAEEIYNGVNPFKSVPKLKVARKEAKSRPWSEVQEVVAEAKYHGRDIALAFILGMFFGIRKLEILRARWEHIDWEAGTITFHKTKPRPMKYTVNLYPEAIEAFLPYRCTKGYIVKPENNDWPAETRYRWEFRKQWDTVFKKVNKAREEKGLPKIKPFSPHQLRHTLITHLSGNGWSLDDIAAFLCQDETDVTKVYGKKGPELRRQTLKISLKERTA